MNDSMVVLTEGGDPLNDEEQEEMMYLFALMDLSGFVLKYGWHRVERDLMSLVSSREADSMVQSAMSYTNE
jgi:hypothetical protein